MLIARGERLFTQTTGTLREEVGRRIQYFQYLMNQEQDPYKLKKHRKNILDFFEHADKYLNSFEDAWQSIGDGSSWYEERSENMQEAEEEYIKWYDGHLTS